MLTTAGNNSSTKSAKLSGVALRLKLKIKKFIKKIKLKNICFSYYQFLCFIKF